LAPFSFPAAPCNEQTKNMRALFFTGAFRFAMAVLFMGLASLVGAQNIQTIASFNFTNGASPTTALTLGKDGNFYGTTEQGGVANSTYPQGMGTIFQLATNGTLTTLTAFSFTNGAYPEASLALGKDGSFYGTTMYGGTVSAEFQDGMGTIFQVTTNGTLRTLASFSGGNGASPKGALTLGNEGSFYGTTDGGGSGYGSVFVVTTSGMLTAPAFFSFGVGGSANGLTLGKDGSFYGTCASVGGGSGSPSGYGSIIHVTADGMLTRLVPFNDENGAFPEAALTLGPDGNFYGTTWQGGSGGYGTVFRVTTNGVLTPLVSFSGTNGGLPEAALTLGNDGNFYGTTTEGIGSGHAGTAFQVTTNGTLTTLVFFSAGNRAFPAAGLTLGNDGNFYGMTVQGGITNATFETGMGTVFRLLLIPIITIQPQSQTNKAGATVTFLCEAILQPTGFQWQEKGTNLTDGGNISGATNSTLTITGITDSNAASYSVIVSNARGSVSSSIATLTVIDPPSIIAQPTNLLVLAGTNVSFGVTVTGTPPFSYQWLWNSSNILNTNNATYTIPSVNSNEAGYYSVVISNAAGAVTSSNAALAVVFSPASQTKYAGASATFTVTAISPQPLSYQWQENGTNLSNGGNISGATNSTLTITGITDRSAASYSVIVSSTRGSVSSSIATLTVIDAPRIIAQPTNLLVLAGTNAAFGVTLTGTPPFSYQWLWNSSNVPNANNATYTIPSVNSNEAGYYSVVVSNAAGSITSSNAALAVVFSPASQTKYAGASATFTVTAISPQPLNYQWQKNGTNLTNGGNISGATNSTLTVSDVADADAAIYSAVVKSAYGSVTSSTASLTVKDSLLIATQPLSQTVGAGSRVTFTAAVYGAPPFVFQWYFSRTAIGPPTAGTNFSSITLTNVGTNQAGNYAVQVFNGTGSLTSSNAVLTVIAQPILSLEMLAGFPALSLSGTLGEGFMVQYNTNLEDATWITLRSLTNLSASPYQFLDPSGAGQPARFYRAFFTP
jgi:uncharacterized repeat protein (TIGR03803 family)